MAGAPPPRQPLAPINLKSLVIILVLRAAAAKNQSHYNSEPSSGASRSQLSRTHCGPGTLCVGGRCIWKKIHRSLDGTLWTATQRGGYPSSCAGCTCQATPWPIDDKCSVTIIPTRKVWVGHNRKRTESDGSGPLSLGMGSRITSMLDIAAFALSNGFGFQMSSRTCSERSRKTTPHCFFQPVSSCGNVFGHVCYESNRNCGGKERIPAELLNKPFVPHPPDWLLNKPFVRNGDALYQAYENSCRIISPDAARECDSPLFAQRVVANITLKMQPHIRKQIEDLIISLPLHNNNYAAVHIRR